MLIGLVLPRTDKERTLADFEEAQSLVHTYGGEVFAAVSQNSTRRDQSTFIGTGKAHEVVDTITKEKNNEGYEKGKGHIKPQYVLTPFFIGT